MQSWRVRWTSAPGAVGTTHRLQFRPTLGTTIKVRDIYQDFHPGRFQQVSPGSYIRRDIVHQRVAFDVMAPGKGGGEVVMRGVYFESDGILRCHFDTLEIFGKTYEVSLVTKARVTTTPTGLRLLRAGGATTLLQKVDF